MKIGQFYEVKSNSFSTIRMVGICVTLTSFHCIRVDSSNTAHYQICCQDSHLKSNTHLPEMSIIDFIEWAKEVKSDVLIINKILNTYNKLNLNNE